MKTFIATVLALGVIAGTANAAVIGSQTGAPATAEWCDDYRTK